MSNIKIAIAQLRSIVGDIDNNVNNLINYISIAHKDNIDLIVTPELFITGYPPEDLLLHKSFIDLQDDALDRLCRTTSDFKNIFILVGHVSFKSNILYNSASLLCNGKILGTYFKHQLPNYSVFDEKRYFHSHYEQFYFFIKNKKIGVMICEDLWKGDYISLYKNSNIDILISINASPFTIGKDKERYLICKDVAYNLNCYLLYVNSVGAHDELVFDGGSFVIDCNGFYNKKLSYWKEEFCYLDLDKCTSLEKNAFHFNEINIESQIWNSLVLSLKDYVENNNFSGVVIGLSGGIDSALAFTIAVDALGPSKVQAVMMSTCYTSDISITDSSLLAKNLGASYRHIDIDKLVMAYNDTMASIDADSDLAKENIQARIRGNILMAISNSSNKLLIATGNKSEFASGYCTLYGDMSGGFALLKDIYKTMVYKLAIWRNGLSKIIPERIISRPPTAELRFNQTDQDSLPPYDIMDQILELYIEKKISAKKIIELGYDREVVYKILNMLYKSQHKRSQSPVGPKITSCSFGKDWRYPITNYFSEK